MVSPATLSRRLMPLFFAATRRHAARRHKCRQSLPWHKPRATPPTSMSLRSRCCRHIEPRHATHVAAARHGGTLVNTLCLPRETRVVRPGKRRQPDGGSQAVAVCRATAPHATTPFASAGTFNVTPPASPSRTSSANRRPPPTAGPPQGTVCPYRRPGTKIRACS